jgi:hypothetical protein
MAIGRAAGPLADRRGSRTLWAAGGRAWEGPDSCAAGRVRLVETKYDLSRTGAAVKGSRKRGTRRRRALTWTRASASRDASRWRGPRALRYAILEPQCKRLGPGRLGAALAPASLRVLLLGQLGSRRARPPGSGTALAERKPRQWHPGNPRSHGSLGTFLHTQSVKRGPLVEVTWFFGVHASAGVHAPSPRQPASHAKRGRCTAAAASAVPTAVSTRALYPERQVLDTCPRLNLSAVNLRMWVAQGFTPLAPAKWCPSLQGTSRSGRRVQHAAWPCRGMNLPESDTGSLQGAVQG